MDSVLIVDDNKEILDTLTLRINLECEAYKCKGFLTDKEAVEYISNTDDNIKVAILDVLLGDGFSGNMRVVSILIKMFPKAHIILITGIDPSDEYMSVFEDNECFTVLYKPFKPDDILRILRVINYGR